ncbi:MAG: glycosyltransferase [Lachnospira sp.]|nr:glycosyltransferase [Lachnospira sp.]
MKVLIFEWKNFGIEDVCEALTNMGHTHHVISTKLMRERVSAELNNIFEEAMSVKYDCVFTFNYSPSISNNCKKHNIPYISLVYDNPVVYLYSYTIINPCNYVFIFDSAQYLDLKQKGINTVYYAPLAVNINRLERQLSNDKGVKYKAPVSFVGSMYNEQHNFFDKFSDLPPYVSGYLDAIMAAQLKVYGCYFIEELLSNEIIKELQKNVPLEPSKDGVETVEYLYAHYFIARKLAAMERKDLLGAVSEHFTTNIYTKNPTPELPHIHNMGPVDYYNDMPYVFANSDINLNISLRSIRSGIPLRCMDIMGAGGFLMSNFQADFYEHFIPGEDLVLFESKEDLLAKCDYYLKHDAERRQIAANGLGKIKEAHTYEVRFKEMFEVVFG